MSDIAQVLKDEEAAVGDAVNLLLRMRAEDPNSIPYSDWVRAIYPILLAPWKDRLAAAEQQVTNIKPTLDALSECYQSAKGRITELELRCLEVRCSICGAHVGTAGPVALQDGHVDFHLRHRCTEPLEG